MKRGMALVVGAFVACLASAQMPRLDDIMKGVGSLPKAPAVGSTVGTGDEKTNAAGIKEALAVGTERAVNSLSRVDGYFGNAAVKILMPSSIQKVAEVARMAGYQKQVDEFILSMNRASEAAAPLAARYFGDAIRDMTLEDVRGILAGGDSAATDFFRRTSGRAGPAFAVRTAVHQVAVLITPSPSSATSRRATRTRTTARRSPRRQPTP